ncbi:hypothetical protein [Alicyclobacillus sp. ALC3]|uniref:hypothetical protein n=1 Tax=Alicyclobacillus sp. ALC3 TaxID=2796143 RepID=UPI0023787C41|nr:hypothetical protein [Alicyclobacillus sp. ALC3]WDL96940.1 hypothetical protein JC200_22120 [Alicyclobacillus sp. ALC3]
MQYGQSVPQELWETVEALKGVFAAQDGAALSNDQMDLITKTFGVDSGFHPYDLAPVAMYLQPVFSPLRNRMPRLHLQGTNMEFKSVLNVDTNNVSGIVAEGKLAPAIATQFADVTTHFKAYGVSSDPVTFEQLYVGAGKAADFNVDSRAIAAANLLKAMFIKEERLMLAGVGSQQQIITSTGSPDNGFAFTIGGAMGNAPDGGSLAAVTTGGQIPASTAVYGVYSAVSSYAVPTGMATNSGLITPTTTQFGQSKPNQTAMSATTGSGTSTNALTFTPPSYSGPLPVLGWVLYLGTNSNGPFYAAGYTTGAPLTVTSVPTSGQQAPTTDTSAGTVANGGTGSSVEGSMNGVLAWIYGTGSQATIKQVNGQPTLATYQNAFTDAFDNAFADPDEFWLNSKDLLFLTGLLTGNNSGQPYWFAAQQGSDQGNMTAGFRVSRFMNPTTSKIMPVNVHAYLPQGTSIALTTELPAWYVGNNVPDVWTWGGAMDYLEVDYQPTANNKQWISEIECVGAIHCFLPSQNILWSGLSAS